MEKNILPIHFEDRSGVEFERLVFAYVARLKKWDKIDWLGQSGNDRGQDILGVFNNESYCYQCKNQRKLNFNEIKESIEQLCNKNLIPNRYIVVCGGKVSEKMKNQIIEFSKVKSIKYTEVWSSAEFEERLRMETPELIRRFVEGEAFPEVPEKLIKFHNTLKDKDRNSYSFKMQDDFKLLKQCINYEECLQEYPKQYGLSDNAAINMFVLGVSFVFSIYIYRAFPNNNLSKFLLSILAFIFIVCVISLLKLILTKQLLQLKPTVAKDAYILEIYEESENVQNNTSNYQRERIIKKALLQFNNGKREVYTLSINKNLSPQDIGIAYIYQNKAILDFKYLFFNADEKLILI